MTHLILLRHGIALAHGTEGMADDDRPLTPKGEARVGEIAKGLGRLNLRLDRILTSPLPRARRTAEIVAARLGMEDRLEDVDTLRAGRSAASIREWIETRPEERLMVVGHDPALSELVGVLLGVSGSPTAFSLKKGGPQPSGQARGGTRSTGSRPRESSVGSASNSRPVGSTTTPRARRAPGAETFRANPDVFTHMRFNPALSPS